MRILMILAFLLLTSCDESTPLSPSVALPQGKGYVVNHDYGAHRDIEVETIEIDGCEYLMYNVGSSMGLLTHKGNCRFCRERGAK